MKDQTQRHAMNRTLLAGLTVAAACTLGGCASNDAQWGGLFGAGLGALAGQAIGGDTEATLIGTAVGAGAGYMIGNESDKARGYHRGYYRDPNYDY